MLTPRGHEDRVFHVAGDELQIVGGDGGCKSGGPSKLPSRLRARRVNKPPQSRASETRRFCRDPSTPAHKRRGPAVGMTTGRWVARWGAAVLRPYKGEPKSTVLSTLPSKIGASRVNPSGLRASPSMLRVNRSECAIDKNWKNEWKSLRPEGRSYRAEARPRQGKQSRDRAETREDRGVGR